MNSPATCQVCGGLLGRSFIAREMMYGTRAEFTYTECENCGCLQLQNRPGDMSTYYPTDYYSYQSPAHGGPVQAIRRWLVGRRNAAMLGRAGVVWQLLARLRPPRGPVLAPWADRLPELVTAERIPRRRVWGRALTPSTRERPVPGSGRARPILAGVHRAAPAGPLGEEVRG